MSTRVAIHASSMSIFSLDIVDLLARNRFLMSCCFSPQAIAISGVLIFEKRDRSVSLMRTRRAFSAVLFMLCYRTQHQ